MTQGKTNDDGVSVRHQRPSRVRYWVIGSLVALGCSVLLFVLVQRRARAEARERAKDDALRALEQAKSDAKTAQQELRSALRTREKERQRYQNQDPESDSATPNEAAPSAADPKAPAD